MLGGNPVTGTMATLPLAAAISQRDKVLQMLDLRFGRGSIFIFLNYSTSRLLSDDYRDFKMHFECHVFF